MIREERTEVIRAMENAPYRLLFCGISGIILDVCRDHGVWLDAGELEQVRCFVANGSLQQAQDHDIFVNQEAIASLDNRLSDVDFMQKLLHHWNLKRFIFDGF